MLVEPGTLHLSPPQVGLLNTAYLVGAVLGALLFGYLTDKLGRKKLFTVTLGLYLAAALLDGVLVELLRASPSFASSPARGSGASTRRSTRRSTS